MNFASMYNTFKTTFSDPEQRNGVKKISFFEKARSFKNIIDYWANNMDEYKSRLNDYWVKAKEDGRVTLKEMFECGTKLGKDLLDGYHDAIDGSIMDRKMTYGEFDFTKYMSPEIYDPKTVWDNMIIQHDLATDNSEIDIEKLCNLDPESLTEIEKTAFPTLVKYLESDFCKEHCNKFESFDNTDTGRKMEAEFEDQMRYEFSKMFSRDMANSSIGFINEFADDPEGMHERMSECVHDMIYDDFKDKNIAELKRTFAETSDSVSKEFLESDGLKTMIERVEQLEKDGPVESYNNAKNALVDKWCKEFGDKYADDMAEMIPYDEDSYKLERIDSCKNFMNEAFAERESWGTIKELPSAKNREYGKVAEALETENKASLALRELGIVPETVNDLSIDFSNFV